MIKRILIPTDGSPNSSIALEYGFSLATFFKAEIVGLNVVDIRSLEGPLLSDISGSLGFSPIQNYLPQFQQILDSRSDTILELFKTSCSEKGISAKTKKMTGIIANIIADEARKADLLIISQHGEHERWSSGLLGSTTESVVRKSPIPVLVTPGAYRRFNNILVAYDGSIESSHALKCALDFFGENSQTIKIVYIAQEEEKGRMLAAEIAEIVTPYNLTYESIWLQGEAAKEILSFAQRTAMDIIVMGAFGHSRLHDLLLGSTAAYIIRNSVIPILLHR